MDGYASPASNDPGGPVVRLVGLWSEPADVDAFEREYLGSHFPRLRELPDADRPTTSRCLDGPYFRMAEVWFPTIDQIHAALETDVGRSILSGARSLAEI